MPHPSVVIDVPLPLVDVLKSSRFSSVSVGVSDVAPLLCDGAGPLRGSGPALQSGSGPAAGHLAPGDAADTSVLLGGARVLVRAQTARERVGGAGPGLGPPHHLSDSIRSSGTFPG